MDAERKSRNPIARSGLESVQAAHAIEAADARWRIGILQNNCAACAWRERSQRRPAWVSEEVFVFELVINPLHAAERKRNPRVPDAKVAQDGRAHRCRNLDC